MVLSIFNNDETASNIAKEGDHYKTLNIHGREFQILYGYYDECERQNPLVDPMPIYPDFLKEPLYTAEGLPFVTKMQDSCEHYKGKGGSFSECADCSYYLHGDELLGVCTCPHNRKK